MVSQMERSGKLDWFGCVAALWPLDGHRTVSQARIMHILTKLTKPFIPINLVGPVNLVDIVWGVFFFWA